MTAGKLSLLSDCRGAAVLELALVAPIFALMTIGVIDMSNAYSRKLALEQGAHRAIEKVMQTTGSTTVENTLKTEAVCQVNGLAEDGTCNTSPITAANVSVAYRLECYDAANSMTTYTEDNADEFDDLVCGVGTVSESKYLEVALTDKFRPMFATHFAGISDDGTYHISARAGMRTK